MTFINEYTIYCAICGGPIEDPDVDDPLHYLQSTKPSLTVGITLTTAGFHGQCYCARAPSLRIPRVEVLENEEAITACDKSGSVVPSPRPLYIPSLTKRVSLAKRAMATQEAASHRGVEDSMQHLWQALKGLLGKASDFFWADL